MTLKRKVSTMALSTDGSKLISGDISGLIYLWNLESPDLTLKTYEIHKDKGAITNLVPIRRPLTLFGLTANNQGYDPS